MTDSEGEDILFTIDTPLGFAVQTTRFYWTVITTMKHPVIRGREDAVRATLSDPHEVRVSRTDPTVYLFYRSDGRQRWLCAVARRLGSAGYLITAYRTSAIKEGARIWPR